MSLSNTGACTCCVVGIINNVKHGQAAQAHKPALDLVAIVSTNIAGGGGGAAAASVEHYIDTMSQLLLLLQQQHVLATEAAPCT